MKTKIPKIKNTDFKLIGKGIILRPLRKADAKDIYKNIQNKIIPQNTLRIPWPYKLKDAQDFIKKSQKKRKEGTGFNFGITLDGKEVIGCCGLHDVDFKHKIAEIGYWLGDKYWGQGITTEATRLVLRFSFRKLKLHRIYADVFPDNIGSRKILKKLGFQEEGMERKAYWRFNRWNDCINFGLLVEEFKDD